MLRSLEIALRMLETAAVLIYLKPDEGDDIIKLATSHEDSLCHKQRSRVPVKT
jgi:hypothetical protein